MRTTLLLFVGIVLYLTFKGMFDSPQWIWFLLGGAAFIQLIAAGNRADRSSGQASRDDVATRVATQIATSTKIDVLAPDLRVRKYILFLRPFPIDRKLLAPNPRKATFAANFIPFYNMALPPHVSFDDAMSFHLKGLGEFVAIGKSGEHVGASRVSVGDADWQDYFRKLATSARALVFFLGLTPSTLWELEFVAGNPDLLEKSLIVLPPIGRGKYSDLFDSPEEIAQRLREIGLAVPQAKAGEGYIFTRDGQIRLHSETVTYSGGAVVKIAKRNLKSMVAKLTSSAEKPLAARPAEVAIH